MRYYKQFHKWYFMKWIFSAFGIFCLYMICAERSLDGKLAYLACGLVGIAAAWRLWKGQGHYLEITDAMIVHKGFKEWRIRKTDVTDIRHGEKGFGYDFDLFLKISAGSKEYSIDTGFLMNRQRLEELLTSIRSYEVQ